MHAIVVGGNGRVARRLVEILAKDSNNTVTPLVRPSSDPNRDPVQELEKLGARASDGSFNVKPLTISLEHESTDAFSKLFAGEHEASKAPKADVVYFAAGAGGKGDSPEEKAKRTRAVDYEGALKVYDALGALKGSNSEKPLLIVISAIDVNRPNSEAENFPDYYNDADKKTSRGMREAIKDYAIAKTDADVDLRPRKNFDWIVLRPSTLTDGSDVGHADLGITHISESISRQNVAEVLALLATRRDAAGLHIDLVGGSTPLEQGLDHAISHGRYLKENKLPDQLTSEWKQ